MGHGEKKARKAKTGKKAAAAAKKGTRFSCGVCGIGVVVDEVCGCVDTCDIVCCGSPMAPKKK